MISEKSDSTQEITRSNDGLKWSEDETIDNSDDDDDVDVDNDDINDDDDKSQNNDNNIDEKMRKVVKVIKT